ncbi:MAG: SprT family protein [Paenibacillaceae bacterium]|uniref:SprT family protein n=1 Tax=Paenibacillus cymbidii TaxID=1639034 RepID=UPI00108008EF|nr:SprT family protein [Paenibacillus cymbidii]MBO9608358.1 SprT family protein [Paenibacillaceae bacterium]
MDDRQLQLWVEQVSLRDFGIPFRHRAIFNSRLRSTGGRYFPKSHHIEISSAQLEVHGAEEVERIIKHELCHYHLHLAKSGYMHRDPEFKALLKKVGGTRYCAAIPASKKAEPYRYRLVCGSCKMEYKRKRKVDPRRYVCGKCRGKLTLHQLQPG